MLWESRDAEVELANRFAFLSPDDAKRWAAQLMSEQYGTEITTVDRMVISAHNLLIWLAAADGRSLLMKICRLTEAHVRLAARAELVGWLADHDLPVAAPL